MKCHKQSIALILLLSMMLNLIGCAGMPFRPDSSSPASISAELEEKDYDIQYYTDRMDLLNEYVPEAAVAVTITTEQGTYHFSENMPVETIYAYMDAFEAGTIFNSEWFGQSYDTLRLYLIQRDFAELYDDPALNISGSGADGIAWIEYNCAAEVPPSPFFASHVLVHETVHALCDVHAETTNFPKRPEPYPFFWSVLLEEGLATMVEHLYGYHCGKLQDVYMYHYVSSGYDSDGNPLDEVTSVAQALNHLALTAIEEDEFYDELPYDILQSYYTAASFLYYLYGHENGGKENLRRVYADINLMEEVYGKDMNGMIEEWLVHLEAYKENSKE